MSAVLEPLRPAVDGGLLVLIWLVQFVIYPALAGMEREGFAERHHRYTRNMGAIVAPLMLAQLGLYTHATLVAPQTSTSLALVLVVLTWATTFVLFVPLHKRLSRQGKDTPTIRRLVRLNWIRTALWTAVFLAGLNAGVRGG